MELPLMKSKSSIAYFSMEIGLDSDMPTYAGGLGVLAGDTIRSAADMGIPFVAISLLPRKGYFYQSIDATGWQTEQPVVWPVEDYLIDTGIVIELEIEQRLIKVRSWLFEVEGSKGNRVPVYFLDTNLPENSEFDRTLTHFLYGGDIFFRLCQEVILGVGGVKMLRALGYANLKRFHMNEGHASLLVIELLNELMAQPHAEERSIDDLYAHIHSKCVFTTHTPVPAGHDKFPVDMANRVLGNKVPFCNLNEDFYYKNELNMTYLALKYSRFVNGVAKKHQEISQHMFSDYKIDSITNGIHIGTWIAKPMEKILNRAIPDWCNDNSSLRYILGVDLESIKQAHRSSKNKLLRDINQHTNAGLNMKHFTIGFARRMTPYKRADLIFSDLDRLKKIAKQFPLQIIYAGKAHPHDHNGKDIIQHIYRLKEELKDSIKIVFLSGYDMNLARELVSGCDIWLNTPQPPMEASGTSGMKAAINGVPSLSVLDGWWIEGCIENVTGWSFDSSEEHKSTQENDANSLYDKLEKTILPLFYNTNDEYVKVMRNAIAINGSFFNTERMLNQYISKAYFGE